MTALSFEERLAKLERQMQKRIDHQNQLSELLYQQAKLQRAILDLVNAFAQAQKIDISEAVSPLLEQYAQNYQQILDELPPDDIQGREYVRSLQDLLRY